MVSRTKIQRFVDDVVRRFRPAAVILFGSYAYGKPTEDSDVDLLVIFERRRSGPEVATKIRLTCPHDFPMDLLVRTRAQVQRRLKMGDQFVHEVTSKGVFLHESDGARVG